MPGKQLLIGNHQFDCSQILTHSLTTEMVHVVKEKVSQINRGIRYDTEFIERKILVHVLYIKYEGKDYYFHDSTALARALVLFGNLEKKGAYSQELERSDIAQAYKDSMAKRDWQYVSNIQELVKELA